MRVRVKNCLLLLVLLVLGVACKTKSDVDAFKEADYSLQQIDKVEVNGVDLMQKKGPNDFSFSDAARLFSAVSANNLSAISTLGLNVSLGEGNESRSMTVTQLKWQLLVDDQKTVSGLVDEPVELKNGLNLITVRSPLKLAEVNGRTDLNSLLQLATLLNQEKADRPKVVLQIKPTILTSVGPFELPAFINIKN
ncbi:hypothetical protein MKJ04_17755 [Pontibacter sp. E15-1]|uniref:hypothetical protein n=1 Tax=Pontibacter sp. E15-1 TaxID=2919918 RepID=UPI001F4F769F|nr:hypothetical protein [Pontibacter sp. E15-1]MCJ8166696.1 hypothetical protein [Pontibacter sp. E15-1]